MQAQILDALRRGAHDEALALARTAVEAEPDSARAQQGLARALSATGDREAALQAIDRAIALAPDEADFHFQRASLLLGARQVDEANQALEQTIALDPNQFGAYILQAQLALGRGETDEAERLARLAARIAPEHPWREMLDGMVALSRSQDDDALRLLSSAAAKAPDDPQVLMGLSLAYMAKGHHAFAEQALRKLLDQTPGHAALRVQLVQILHRQRRTDDALEALQPLLGDDASAPMLGLAGELELAAGRPEQALAWLRRALGIDPRNERVLPLAMAAWRQLGDVDDARATLESALATTRDAVSLWHARLALEDGAVEGAAGEVVTRWNQAMPEHPAALEAKMRLLQLQGDGAAALEVARSIVARAPGHAGAQMLIVEDIKSRDPDAARAYVAELLPQAGSAQSKAMVGLWLASLEDAAGKYADALTRWTALAAERAPGLLPLPPVSLPDSEVPAGPLPPWQPGDSAELDTVFLWGPPGSCVERVAAVLSVLGGFRGDRFSADGVRDGFQTFSSVPKLSLGEIDPAEFIAGWRQGLATRGIEGDRVIEWLVWWDNALLRVLRPQLQKAAVMFVVRDPRDMLLQWLAFGSPMGIGLASVPQAAAWLATLLSRVAEVGEQRLYRYALLRIDGMENDNAALAKAVSDAVGVELPVYEHAPGAGFPPGHWRKYADLLAEPFAMLTPVAMRLGYPET